MTTRATRALLLILAGILLGFWICFFHPMPRVDAQGVGFFGTSTTGTRTNCTQVTSPVVGQTVCLDQAANTWKYYTGASQTTAQWVSGVASLTGVNNVRDFGATGDGVTDDTTAIQNALNAACPNGAVLFPGTAFSYLHTATLTVPSYCTLLGDDNPVIKAKPGTSDQVMGFNVTGKTRVAFRGLIYDGNRAGRTQGGTPTAFGILVANSSEITIRDVVVQNSLWDGIELAYTNPADATTRSHAIVIDNTIVTNSMRNNLTVDGAYDVTVLRSRFTGADTNSPKAGIEVEADNGTIFNENVWFIGVDSTGNVGDGLTFAQFNKNSGVMGGRYSGNNGFGIAINTAGAPDNLGVVAWYPQFANNLLGDFRRLTANAAVYYFSTATNTNVVDAGPVPNNWALVPTTTNTASAIVQRDAAGAFSAGQVTVNSLNIGAGGNNGNISYATDLTLFGPTSGAFLLRPSNAPLPVIVVKSFVGNATVTTFNLGVQIGAPSAGDPGAGGLRVASSVWLNATQTLWNGGTTTGTPQCTNNCGTSPSLTGNNTAMRVTMGATGTPATPFLVLFNGTWNATPACLAQIDTPGTTAATVTRANATTTGVQINTVVNPPNSAVYSIHCLGVG